MRKPEPTEPATATNTLLLEALKDPRNQTVWRQYVDRFRPPIVRYLRRFGLSAQDSEDVAQLALIAFSKAYKRGKYDRARGRLRDWLFGIVRLEARNWRRRRPAREVQRGGEDDQTDFFAALSSEDDAERVWNEEWKAGALQRCLIEVQKEVQPQSVTAFVLFALKGWSAQKVSEHLGISENAVYGAKRRIIKRLRELLPLFDEGW